MLLVKSIMLRKALSIKTCFLSLALFSVVFSFAQENSPYSRYGIGNLVPNTNIVNRGMGGVTAAYSDFLTINYNNPASYAAFQTILEAKSKKPASGRVLFDAGLNLESKTLREPNQPLKFTNTNALFSYLQLGIPLNKNWGLSFGLRPISRINYKINRNEKLYDPITNLPIDSALTQFNGNGGTFLPSIGTGVAIKNFSVGVNVGYLFGRKEFSTQRGLIDTSANYNISNFTSNTYFGSLYFNAGFQYKINIDKTNTLTLGASGNLQQELKGSQDITRESIGTTSDTVYKQSGVKGKVIYPASYTAGFVFEHRSGNSGTLLIGTDLVQTKWSDYRFFGAVDSVQNNWQLRVGGHYRPNAKTGSGYFSNVTYRAGFFFGPDYIHIVNKVPVTGITFGLGLPVANYNRLAPGQFTVLNVALEYEKRGNNTNLMKENNFRLSIGFNFSDLWFNKRKYD